MAQLMTAMGRFRPFNNFLNERQEMPLSFPKENGPLSANL